MGLVAPTGRCFSALEKASGAARVGAGAAYATTLCCYIAPRKTPLIWSSVSHPAVEDSVWERVTPVGSAIPGQEFHELSQKGSQA